MPFLPPEVKFYLFDTFQVVTCYEEFYAKQFNGRKLTWLHHLSNGDVKLGYLPKAYIVNMTTFQVCSFR